MTELISADSPSDETLNRSLLALLLRRQYEFLFEIKIVHFHFFFYSEWLFLSQKILFKVATLQSKIS